MDIVINDNNLQINEIQEFSEKARAILIDDNNQVLIANYGGIILLPGGSIDKEEKNLEALIRELKEEIGQDYKENELKYLNCLIHFQKNYPKRDGTVKNRLVKTHLFIGKFKGISKSSQTLTNKEKKDNFKLELISLEELENIILENKDNNPRNIYFQQEMLATLKLYNNSTQENKIKTLKK